MRCCPPRREKNSEDKDARIGSEKEFDIGVVCVIFVRSKKRKEKLAITYLQRLLFHRWS